MADVKGHKYLCRMPFSQTACLQCDQIGLFMRILGDKISDKISNKMSPKDWQCFGLFCKNLTLLCKNCCGYFWGCFWKGLGFYSPASGHTACLSKWMKHITSELGKENHLRMKIFTKLYFFKWAIPGHFFCIFVFSIQLTVNNIQ